MPTPDIWSTPSPATPPTSPAGRGGVPVRTHATTVACSAEEREALLQLAAEILRNPLAVQNLCDRVYTLMEQDLQRQSERKQSYGRWK